MRPFLRSKLAEHGQRMQFLGEETNLITPNQLHCIQRCRITNVIYTAKAQLTTHILMRITRYMNTGTHAHGHLGPPYTALITIAC